MASNDALVLRLHSDRVISSPEVIDAMERTDRGQYIATGQTPDGHPIDALDVYEEHPLPIGYNQTISAPHMHGLALQWASAAIENVNHPRMLDVGAGSGYLTACLGRLVQSKGGRVFGLEIMSPLVEFAQRNLEHADGDLVSNGVVDLTCGNGWDGLPEEGPFHFIHVGAAAEVPPQALMDQLAEGGSMIVPLDTYDGGQTLVEIQRHGRVFTQRYLKNVRYVPLVHAPRSC